MPCATLLTRWYEPEESGAWWGIISTSGTVGASIAQIGFPIVCVTLLDGSWRATMMVVSICPIISSLIIVLFLAPSPEAVGLKPGSIETDRKSTSQLLSSRQRLIVVLSRPGVHLLSLSSLFVYTLRMAVTNWLLIYCRTQKGFSSVEASGITFWMEIGGIVGSTFSGWLSDQVFGRRRAPVNALFSLGAGLTIYSFQFLEGAPAMSLGMFIFGFFLYGPQTVRCLSCLSESNDLCSS
jgi:MFS transporter, OPA family, sugar phosphate sensor protein UhpC